MGDNEYKNIELKYDDLAKAKMDLDKINKWFKYTHANQTFDIPAEFDSDFLIDELNLPGGHPTGYALLYKVETTYSEKQII